MPVQHALRLRGSEVWVIHRRREYGPFDYEWSSDFCGVALLYAGRKFGEYCSQDEFCADLGDFPVPLTVSQVGSLALGCVLYGLMRGYTEQERRELIGTQLQRHGFGHFQLQDQADCREID